jgi:hypothetical protein
MMSRASQTHLAGHMRPAGRVFETPGLKRQIELQITSLIVKTSKIF